MKTHSLLLILFIVPLSGIAFTPMQGEAQVAPIDLALAHQYFQEAEALCKEDSGKVWGVSLCGPIVFADPRTRAVVGNQRDLEGHLSLNGNVFVGTLPRNVNIAYTATSWAGVKWTMVIWPLPSNKVERARLLAHELWHRVQEKIGLPGSGPSNHHLDSLEGRIWMQLEWRALQVALKHQGKERRKAIEDALVFRAYRRKLFPEAETEERALEMHEGLAAYTGVKLRGAPNLAEYTTQQLKEAEKTETFVRSFAYASGPAWGLLLDAASKNWRKGLTPENDLGLLLQKAVSIKLPQSLKRQAEKAANNYDGQALRASETERDNQRRQRFAMYRAKLVEGPLIILPLQKMSTQFNPDNLQSFGPLGTVYPNIRIVDVWGILNVSNGALMNPTFTRIQVAAPMDLHARPIQGDGWTLELNPGWTIAPGERKGDYVLKKSE